MPTAPESSAQPRVILITGTSSGIGQACARHLAARGWRVFGTQRAEPSGTPVDGVEIVSMDVDDDASVAAGVARVVERTGRLDAVVNNAGYAAAGAVEDTSIAEAKAQFETNFFGVLRVCRAVLPILRSQGGGYLVNISSLAGTFGMPYAGMYSASKHAIEGLSESLRFEVSRFGIKVVMIEPGDFNTGMTQRRRVAAESTTNPAYREAFARALDKQNRDETTAPTPESIARLLERILNDPRPKLRYPIGMASQTMVGPLRRFLPQRAFEWLGFKLLET
jgi:NAD(P)-dependent dehydrogenase (short-subunit alcohol dehydrogenase family)